MKLQPADIEKIFLNIADSARKINPAFMNWSKSSIREVISTANFRFYKTDLNEIAAMICYQTNSEFTEILALGTVSEFQRQGYSEKLLNQFLSECGSTSKLSTGLVTLEVHCKNDSAIALYEKCGFKTVRIRKNYYSDGADAFVMDKFCCI